MVHKLTIQEKLSILHFERGHYRLLRGACDLCAYGITFLDFRTKTELKFDYMVVSDIIDEDFEKLYSSEDASIVSKEFHDLWYNIAKEPNSAKGWHIGDTLSGILADFLMGDEEINEENLQKIEEEILSVYNIYTRLKKYVLPPKLPNEVTNG